MIDHPLLGDDQIYNHKDENGHWKMAFFVSVIFLILVIATGLYVKRRGAEKISQENQINTTHLKAVEKPKEIPNDFPYLAYTVDLKQNYYLEDNTTGKKQLVRKWSTEASLEQSEKIISNYLSRNGWNQTLRDEKPNQRTLAVQKDGEGLSVTISETDTEGQVDIEIILHVNESLLLSACKNETTLSKTDEPRFIPEVFQKVQKQNAVGNEKLSQAGEWCESIYTYEVSTNIQETASAYESWINYLNNGWSNTEKVESGQYIMLTGIDSKNRISIRVSPNEANQNTNVEVRVNEQITQ